MAPQSGSTPELDEPPSPVEPDIRALVGDAVAFAANAGFANTVVFLSVFRASVTHMTGRARNLSVALESFDWRLVGVSIGLIVAFMAGSAISGLLVPQRDLDFGLPYRRVFFLEGCLLAAASTLLVVDVEAGIYLAAMAFGLQNGKATFYSGVVIRTSHVTGIITDIGVDLGLLLRRKRVPSINVAIKDMYYMNIWPKYRQIGRRDTRNPRPGQ